MDLPIFSSPNMCIFTFLHCYHHYNVCPSLYFCRCPADEIRSDWTCAVMQITPRHLFDRPADLVAMPVAAAYLDAHTTVLCSSHFVQEETRESHFRKGFRPFFCCSDMARQRPRVTERDTHSTIISETASKFYAHFSFFLFYLFCIVAWTLWSFGSTGYLFCLKRVRKWIRTSARGPL